MLIRDRFDMTFRNHNNFFLTLIDIWGLKIKVKLCPLKKVGYICQSENPLKIMNNFYFMLNIL